MLLQRVILRGIYSKRSDDNETSFKKRMVTFRNETQPVIDYYSKIGKAHGVIFSIKYDFFKSFKM